jgi:hypothetical protein
MEVGVIYTSNANSTKSQRSKNSQENKRLPNGAILRKPKLPTGNVFKTTKTCATGENGVPCMKNVNSMIFR